MPYLKSGRDAARSLLGAEPVVPLGRRRQSSRGSTTRLGEEKYKTLRPWLTSSSSPCSSGLGSILKCSAKMGFG